MALFELVIALLVGAAALTTLSRRLSIPYPVVLAVAGAALALLPTDKTDFRLDPDLALALFVAPVLLDAAFDTSPRDLRRNWAPVVSLVFFAVVVTVAAVAVVARLIVPDMPWPVAIALGAIVAPSDATAATSILRFVAPPHRVLVILEGESLLNDASALLIYRLAVGAAMGASLSPWQAVPSLLFAAGGGVVLGIVAGRIFPLLTRPIDDIPAHVAMQFAGTFAVWIGADAIGVSPILTVVAYAMTIAQTAAARQGAENRRTSFAVWEVAVYALNALAFILAGLQLSPILREIDGQRGAYIGFTLAVLATVILARVGWVLLVRGGRRFLPWVRDPDAEPPPPFAASLVIGWSGMRGIVTLATALALPYALPGGAPFPHRDLLVAAAFGVVLGTLVLQGLTLGPLLRWLHLSDDGAIEHEEKLARHELARAAVAMLRDRREDEAKLLREEYAVRMREQTTDASVDAGVIGTLRMAAITAERQALEKLRRNHTIGDGTYHVLEEELDWAEGHALTRKRALDELGPLDQGLDERAVAEMRHGIDGAGRAG